ncbi:pyocin knob domain-containing S74 family peptidase [Aeromonas hydrophila]|uniref:pyocin knob domain-containing S74 family peptidase n=1 Tax=Aeromonas hydrophila TaxID=644 RepID=UPI0039898CBE
MAANNIVFDIDKAASKITTPYMIDANRIRSNNQIEIFDPTGVYAQRLVTANGITYLQGGKVDRDITDQKMMLSGWYGTPLSDFRINMATGTQPKVRIEGASTYDILHRGNMPTAEEIKAMAVYDRPIDDDCNNATMPGNFGIFANTKNTPLGTGPSGSTLLVTKWGNGASSQIFIPYTSDRVFVRRMYIGVWQPWFELYSTSNKPTATDVGTMTTTQINTELAKKADLTYVNTELGKKADKSYTDTELGKKLSLSGGTMTGSLVVANTKGAIKVDNQKSISFQDQANTIFHAMAEGNSFKIKHGNNGDNGILSISPGSIESSTTLFTRGGVISQDSTSTKWLGLETPAGANPYISVRSTGDSQNRVAMTFEKGAIRVSTDTLVAASMLVVNNGGLVLAPDTGRVGVTWGMGIDASTREFNIHRYLNGVWQQLPVTIATDGTFKANSGLYASTITCANNASIGGSMSVGGINVTGGYMSLTSGGNTLLEFHTPGRTAAMIYKGPEGNMRFVTSNGAGGETVVRMVLDTGGNMSVVGEIFCSKLNQTSDIRLKSNVVKLDRVLDRCAAIDAYSYEKNGSREVGVIAQDVALGLEDAVGHTEVDGEDRLTVNYGSISTLALAGVNELHTLVKELRSEIEELKLLNLINV